MSADQVSVRATLDRIATCSADRGFAWLVLNGLPQAERLYRDTVTRSLGAIDILSAPGEAHRLSQILQAAHFTPASWDNGGPHLYRAALQTDQRILLRSPEGEVVNLHERRLFDGDPAAALLGRWPPRRSRHATDVPAPEVGPAMAMDILLRGNARRWKDCKWRGDLAAVIGHLDPGAIATLLDAIEAGEFSAGARASLIYLRDTEGVTLPDAMRAWVQRDSGSPEILARLSLYAAETQARMSGAQSSFRPQRLGRWDRVREIFTRRMRISGQYTSEPATRLDRYPLAFHFAQNWLGSDERHHILSFGCSTGEEALSLRRYFPAATIKGIDVDPHRIAVARAAASGDGNIRFEVAATAANEIAGTYDAIFCMAVFRDPRLDHPGSTHADRAISFPTFDQEIATLVRCLKPGGLLFVTHANFRVADTGAMPKLRPVLNADPPGSGKSPGLYGRDGKRLFGVLNRAIGFLKDGG